MSDPNPQPAEHNHATLSGRWLVVLTLSLFLLVPTITYFSFKATLATPARVNLDYDQRAKWFMQPVKPRPLKYSTFVAAETGKEYKKTDLTIDPEVEKALRQLVYLVQRDDFFENQQTPKRLRPYAEKPVYGFYPAYLLASWYQVNGNTEQFDAWIRVTFDRAEGAIAQKFIDSDANPVADYRLPPVAIGYDRVTDGKLDATLVLVYPAPISHANGFVYLPTYRSVYRLTDPALPLGVDPGFHPTRLTLLPQANGGSDPNWFSVPDGAVGRLDDAVVSE